MEKMANIMQGKNRYPLYTKPVHLNGSVNERSRQEYMNKVKVDNQVQYFELGSYKFKITRLYYAV